MQTSIGQCIALATFANARLAGYDARLDLRTHPWFQFWSDYRFGVGDDESQVLALSFDEWVDVLKSQRIDHAYLWFEPFDGEWETIESVALSGIARWAPVTARPDLQLIWHERLEHDESNAARPWRTWRGGYAVHAGQTSIFATPEEAGRSLDAALVALIAFTAEHRVQSRFLEAFERARATLEESRQPADDPVYAQVDLVFPPGLYPPTSRVLVFAVAQAWVLGGTGSWNDGTAPSPEVQRTFERLTIDYYRAIGECLFAACNVRLASR